MAQTLSPADGNKAFFGLLDGNAGQIKQAADIVSNFTRIRIRESSAFEKVMPSTKIGNDDLVPQLATDKNVTLVHREPSSPGAVTVPLGTQPVQYYFRGDMYPVFFDRIVTPKFTKDTSELRKYGYDIRQLLADNAILDMDYEFDRKMLAAAATIVGAEGSTVPETGIIQNKVIVDALGITRDALFEVRKILPSTFAHLEGVTFLVNNITIHDIAKFDRNDAGGDLSQDMFINGFNQKTLLGLNWIVTSKTDLVPTNVAWIFASPEFMGKSFVLEDVTMFLDKRAFNLEFFAYTERGATIGNPASVARVRFSTTP